MEDATGLDKNGPKSKSLSPDIQSSMLPPYTDNIYGSGSLLKVSSRVSSESQSFQRNDIMSMSVLIDNSSRRKTSRSDKRSRLSCQQRVEGDDEIAASRLAYGGRKSSIPKYDQTTNRNNRQNLNDPHNTASSATIGNYSVSQTSTRNTAHKNMPKSLKSDYSNPPETYDKNLGSQTKNSRSRSNTTGNIRVTRITENSNQTMKSSKSRRRCQSVLSYQGMSPKSGMVRRIALRSRSTWQPDETAEYCAKCERKFTGWITSGKHHCRRCGRIFCSSCCNLFVTLPDDWRAHSIASKSWGIIPSLTYQKENDRVCTDCFDNFSLVQENPRVQLYLKILRLCMITGFIELPWLWSCVDVWMGKYWRAASDELKSQLRVLQYKLPTHVYSKKERELLWSNRHVLAGHSAWLLPLMKSVDWSDLGEVEDAEAILKMLPHQLKNFSNPKYKRKRGAQLGCVHVPWTKINNSSNVMDGTQKFCYAQADCLHNMCTRHCKSHIMPSHAIQLLSSWQAKGTHSPYFSTSKKILKLSRKIELLEKYLNTIPNTNKWSTNISRVKVKLAKLINCKRAFEKSTNLQGMRINPLPESARKIIVRSFKDVEETELLCYLPSMIQCLLDRRSPTISALSTFLFKRTLKEAQLRNGLYWGLLSINSELSSGQKNRICGMNCQSIRETLCNNLPAEKREELTRGYQLVSILSSVPTDLEAKALSHYLRSCIEEQGVFCRHETIDSAWGSSLMISNSQSCEKMGLGNGESENSSKSPVCSANNNMSLNSVPLPDQNYKTKVSVALPVAPRKKITSILYDTAKRMTSAERPYVVKMKNDYTQKVTTVAFKTDDMRRDQILLNCIRLMDIILKRELGRKSGDYKLITYRVLPTSANSGLVEFVDNAEVLEDIINDPNKKHWGNINNYFLERARFIHNQSLKQRSGSNGHSNASAISLESIHSKMKDNFTRSLAGYCVVSYLLGVGDRHRHNIMLTHDGKIFNIDFGWCLGQDPKPFQPALRLDDFLIAGLGGKGSSRFNTFISLANKAFNVLRRHVSTFTSLLLPLTSDYGYFGGTIGTLDSKQLLEHMYWRYLPGTHDEEASAIFPRKLNGEYDGAGIQKVAQAVSDAVHTEVHQRSLEKVGRAAVDRVTGGVRIVYKTIESAALPATNVIADFASAAYEKIRKKDGVRNEGYGDDAVHMGIEDDWEFVDVDDDVPIDEI